MLKFSYFFHYFVLLLYDLNSILIYPSLVTEMVDLGKEVFIYKECFKSKFCHGYPLGCIEGRECDILATAALVNSSKHVRIDLYNGNLMEDQYVAVGFSKDRSMGDDLVFMCSPSEEVPMKGWNPRHRRPEDVSGITEFDFSKGNKEGMFHCKFELEKMLTFTKAASVEQMTFDFSQMYHLLVATGQMESKMTIGPHGLRKAASEDSVNVTSFVKNERLESTTEGSIWNLSLFSYFPFQHVNCCACILSLCLLF